jgi:hypothetical protein
MKDFPKILPFLPDARLPCTITVQGLREVLPLRDERRGEGRCESEFPLASKAAMKGGRTLILTQQAKKSI